MRGDMQSHLHHDNLQNDSSSGSSSPHSNTSHEETLDDGPELLPQKVVYNFSIPEFINHEPRIDRDDRTHMESVRRKRNRAQRQQQEPQNRDEVIEAPVIVHTKKKRRRAAAAAANLDDGDRDDDCHRRNVPVIDLTGVDSHDDVDSEHSSSRDDRSSIFRPFRPRDHGAASYTDILSNFERYQHHLPARERHERRLHYRSPSLQRLHRIQQLRRRNEAHRQSSRQIITDGPRYTEDMLVRTPEPENPSTPEHSEGGADDSVLVVSEIRGNLPEDDRTIAQRMENDPNYSPPYYTPPHSSHSRLNGSSYQLINERFRALRQRRELTSSSQQVAQIQHIRQLLERDRRQQARPTNEGMGLRSNRDRTTANENNTDNNNINNDNTNSQQQQLQQQQQQQPQQQPQHQNDNENTTTNEQNNLAARMNASGNPRDDANNSDDSGDGEVEFIGEWNSANNNTLRSSLRSRSFHPALIPLSLNSPIYPFHDLQDGHFLRLLPTPPNRLHHIYQENYEALLNLADSLGPGKPRGLEKSEIDRIPSFRFSSNTAKETNAKCVVCISEYSNREKLRRLPCSHDFHAKCIDKWLKSNKTCPVCRDEVKVASTE